jgi:predicted ATP-grasp superfamily ATP-dependent carboligase
MINPEKRFFERYTEPIAFILGVYPSSNLGAVRNLGRHGVPTMVLDTKKNQAAFFSKYAKGILCPHPKYSEEQYINFILDLGEQLPMKGVLFPTGDTETLALLRHRTKLEQYYRFTMADYNIVNNLINKQKLYRLLENLHIPHPKTFVPYDEHEVETASRDLSYPCIIKPVYPTYFRLDFDTKLFIASSQTELISLYTKAHEKHHEVLLQEVIPGGAETMFGCNAYYDQTGRSHGKFVYQRIREWPLGFGNGCYIQHVQQPILEQVSDTLVKHLRYYGIVDAEFKYDARDGQFKFIEVNPRIWMQNSFPSRYGYNIPYMAYLDAIGKPLPETTSLPPKKDVKWVYFVEDIQSSRAELKTGGLTIHQWVQAYRLSNDHAVFVWDDPLPFVLLGCQSISSLFPTLFQQPERKK